MRNVRKNMRLKLVMIIVLSILIGCTKESPKVIEKANEQIFNDKLDVLVRNKQSFVVSITELAPFEWDSVCQLTPYAIDSHPIRSQYPFLTNSLSYKEYVAIFEGYGFLFLTKKTQKITFIQQPFGYETDRQALRKDKLSVQNQFLSKNLDEVCFSRNDNVVLQRVASQNTPTVLYLILLKKDK